MKIIKDSLFFYYFPLHILSKLLAEEKKKSFHKHIIFVYMKKKYFIFRWKIYFSVIFILIITDDDFY